MYDGGPNRDNLSAENAAARQLEDPTAIAWRLKGIGKGYASPVVANGVVYTMGNQADTDHGERGRAGAKTANRSGGPASAESLNWGYAGSRSTPAVDGEGLMVLHPDGSLVCLNAATGERPRERTRRS